MTKTLNENLERWTEWVKDMFTTENVTPKMEHLKDEFWQREPNIIKELDGKEEENQGEIIKIVKKERSNANRNDGKK